jgi:glycerol-3-phosphate dehydrogenase (NAD(P)+)
MSESLKVAVFGGGSWATALVKMLCENLPRVGWYMRSEATIQHIETHNHNPNYISSAEFKTEQLFLSNDIDELAACAEVLIFAVPSVYFNQTFANIRADLSKKIVFSAIKGIVPETGLIVGEHLHKAFEIPYENIGVITGPCHAEEVAMERLSYLTLACQDEAKAACLGEMMSGDYIKCKISDDIIGTEYAAMLKNIYAIAAGIAHGLGYGDNFQSVLMSNAIREMKRYIKKVHKMKRNINNSAYLGDLLVTGYSVFSRNRMFGNMLGKGYTVKAAMIEMNMVAEGYYALKSAYKNNQKHRARTPIIDTVYKVVYLKKSPKKQFKLLADLLD